MVWTVMANESPTRDNATPSHEGGIRGIKPLPSMPRGPVTRITRTPKQSTIDPATRLTAPFRLLALAEFPSKISRFAIIP